MAVRVYNARVTYDVAPRDPGPMARLVQVKADPDVPSVIFQRLTEKETLPQIAKAWKVPKGRFVEWFTTEHAGLYDAALKVLAADYAIDAMNAALAATPETVAVAKLQSDVALKLASKFDRARYGEHVKVEREVSVLVDAGLLGTAGDLLRRIAERKASALDSLSERITRVIEQEPVSASAGGGRLDSPPLESMPVGVLPARSDAPRTPPAQVTSLGMVTGSVFDSWRRLTEAVDPWRGGTRY